MNIKKLFKKIFSKSKKITREDAIQNINNSYHFKNFNVNLVDEIYTFNEYKYDIIFPDGIVYRLNDKGLLSRT